MDTTQPHSRPVGSQLGRRLSMVAILAVIGMLAAPLGGAATAQTADCSFRNGLGSFNSPEVLPGACWRPYSDASPFNRAIPKKSRVARGSKAMVRRLLSGGRASYIVGGDPARDAGNPTYFPDSADPLYTLHCNRPWGTCEIEGHQIRVPAQALPAQGYATAEDDHDAHMTIVDQASGWEYDLWNVRSKPDAGGTLVFGWGGRTRIDGNGLGSGGTSAHFGNLAGIIRSEELLAGRIDHALVMGVPCSDSFVYPADNHGLPCRAAGLPSAHSWPTGSHFQLNVKPKKIKRWKIPRYRKAIAIALSRYGAYVSDTSGLATEWGFEIESGATYQSFGAEDGLTRLARALKLPPEDYNNNGIGEYWFNVDKGIKWSKLRIVAPCVARGAC